MSDLISRNTLIEDLMMIEVHHPYDTKEDILEQTQATIDRQPTVEAKPVVYGKWETAKPKCHIHYSPCYAECSICHEVSFDGWRDNFCKHCGSDMRKKAK